MLRNPEKIHQHRCEVQGEVLKNSEFEFCWNLGQIQKSLTSVCWNFEIWAVRRIANLVDLEKCWKMTIYLQKSVSIQPRTRPRSSFSGEWVSLRVSHSEPTREPLREERNFQSLTDWKNWPIPKFCRNFTRFWEFSYPVTWNSRESQILTDCGYGGGVK